MLAATEKILCHVDPRSRIATVVLNRPKALNSLDTDMVEGLSELLGSWTAGPASHTVACVIVKGAGDKAFCAGGDVKKCVEEAAASGPEGPMRFFDSEYRMNLQISQLSLPYIALMDGVVMGGGVGVSVHGQFRVVTERTVFAMPECAIGLFPDIGASAFLQRLLGRGLGLWLALTGARLKGVDVRSAGLATHYLPSRLLPELEARLHRLGEQRASGPPSGYSSRAPPSSSASSSAPAHHLPGTSPYASGGVNSVRGRYLDLSEINDVICGLEAEAGPMPEGHLGAQLPWISRHFGNSSSGGSGPVLASEAVEHIISSLRQRQSQLTDVGPEAAWIGETLQSLAKSSPLSQCVTMELFRRTKGATLEACLEQDNRLVKKFVAGQGDFAEGVTATLIDRGRQPAWKYSSVGQVPGRVVTAFFETEGSVEPLVKPNSRM